MNISLSENTIFDFEDFTGFDLQGYFSDFLNFVNNGLPVFINFYNGKATSIDTDNYNSFFALLNKSEELSDLLKQQSVNFITCDFANLVEMIDTIRIQLLKIVKLAVFLKSSLAGINSTSNVVVDKIVANYETMETVHSDLPNNQNGWVDTAVNNRIYEESFNEQNGYNIKLQRSNVLNFDLKSVIDRLYGSNLYGKDINKSIVFNSDFSDIQSLNGEDTFSQSIGILANMKKQDNPLYPEAGIDPTLIFGNLIGLNIPFIITELNNTFALDDTVADFSVDNMQSKGNELVLDISCKSFYNKTFSVNLSLNG